MNPPGRTAVVMSRLPRLIEPRATWLQGLRAALRHVKRMGTGLVTIDGTAGVDFVRRAAERLGIPAERGHINEVIQSEITVAEDSIPQRDRLLVGEADTVLALGVRTNGNVHRLLRDRLATGRAVVLVDLPGLQARSVRDELISLGARCWVPDVQDQSPFNELHPRRAKQESVAVAEQLPGGVCEIVPLPVADEWMFLSHTTRACPGPWPNQSGDDYIDSLLDETSDADHSPTAALVRIVRQRRLTASGCAIRGGFPVVCFTAVPLSELPNLRQFRTHRARWDFEPFGICIHRDWLERLGTRPVVYGPEEAWRNLRDADRPWFQLSQEKVTGSDDQFRSHIDWSAEREWRHVGDIDLSTLPADAALVFVPDFAAAQRVFVDSPWPVTLWPGERGSDEF